MKRLAAAGVGAGDGVGVGLGLGEGAGEGLGVGKGVGVGVGIGVAPGLGIAGGKAPWMVVVPQLVSNPPRSRTRNNPRSRANHVRPICPIPIALKT